MTLANLQKAFTLPKYDELLMKGETFLHEKQEEVDRLIALYDIQHSADYDVSRLQSKHKGYLIAKNNEEKRMKTGEDMPETIKYY